MFCCFFTEVWYIYAAYDAPGSRLTFCPCTRSDACGQSSNSCVCILCEHETIQCKHHTVYPHMYVRIHTYANELRSKAHIQIRNSSTHFAEPTLQTTTSSALKAKTYDAIHIRTSHPNTYAISHTPTFIDERTNHPSTPNKLHHHGFQLWSPLNHLLTHVILVRVAWWLPIYTRKSTYMQ